MMLFGTPTPIAKAPSAAETSPNPKKRSFEAVEFSQFDLVENDAQGINVPIETKTAVKIETSFRTFLASFPATTTTSSSSSNHRMPPPLKKGDARFSVEERLARLERSGGNPERFAFLQAAANAARTIDPGYQKLGEGCFSNVYSVPVQGNGPALVKKVFKEDCSTGGSSRALQGTPRLYKLAEASEEQFRKIRDAYNRREISIDVLDILNLGTWKQDGFFTQPLVTQMFQPYWEAFVARITLHGHAAQITADEEALLQTIQSVFKRSIELNLCIDFKPDNLGLISAQGETRIVIIDTFGLSGNSPSEMKAMARANINEFAKGNSAIAAFLSQAVDQ